MSSTSKKSGKGTIDGVISEMSTFFTVKEGHEAELREATQRFVKAVRGLGLEVGLKTGLRDSRHVMFDDDRRLAWFTTFETEWDVYMDDAIACVGFKHFLDWMQHTVEGDKFGDWAKESGGLEALDPSNPDVDAAVTQYSGGMKDIIQSLQIPASSYFNALSDMTLSQAVKMGKLSAAFEQVLDGPDAEKALQNPALKPLLDQAAS